MDIVTFMVGVGSIGVEGTQGELKSGESKVVAMSDVSEWVSVTAAPRS